ncbi:MAG: helix-turn-helix transcriptional regulator [Oscillospiraceae bacterium]|nr:helix-turn-helix transcriptional regulator [Oscillospiraceae bacterium]
MKFGEKVRTLRLQQEKSQQACADAAGVSRRAYIAYETEGKLPRTREVYQRLAAFFGVELTYLLTDDEEFVAEASAEYGSRGRRQAEALLAEMTGLFAGGELSESDRDAIMIAMQKVYFECKANNKKYGSHKKDD